MADANEKKSPYRGALKHKARPSRGRKGTLCPEWTHTAASGARLGNDPFQHDWADTVAHALFANAEEDPSQPGRLFATARGVAFTAKRSNDGTWHGYPVPWEEAPADLKDKWLEDGRLRKKDLNRYLSRKESEYKWPLETDD